MSDTRAAARLVKGAALIVALSVASNQIFSDGDLSWTWLYLSLLLAVLVELHTRFGGDFRAVGGGPVGGALGMRRNDYLRRVRASVEKMETVGITTQNEFVLRMRHVYVDVSVKRRPLHDATREPALGTAVASSGESKRRTLQSFLDEKENRVLAVIGGAGSGKTTLARSTALNLCEPSWRLWRRRPLPVLLYLRDHSAKLVSDEPPSLAELAASVGWLNGKVPAAWLEQRLHEGECVVLLDGLDEVADEQVRGRVVAWVEQQIQRDPGNRYVITSRPHGYESRPLANAEVLQVRRFTRGQIADFLYGWYYAVEGRAQDAADAQVKADADAKAEDLLRRLKDQSALYDLAANPLLLTMIANVHRFRDKLPGTRAALYGEMCDVLVHRRYEARELTDATGLRGPQKERVLRHLALAMMRARVRDIPAGEACAAIAETLSNISQEVAPATFLEEIRKSGLLVEHEQGLYAFAHMSFQEYLTAAEIDQHPELLTDHVDDPWWRETTLLWAANADATPVVTACLAAGTVRALALAFDCADEAVEVDRDVRRQLEEVLDTPDGNEDRRRLINGIAAARTLREAAPLDGDAALCKKPVSRNLYARFLQDERAAGRQTPGDHSGGPEGESGETGPDVPAVGMWAHDAARFVTWLNDLFDDGTTYRLPTPDELADPAVDLSEHTAWASPPPALEPRLHRPEGVPWPYELDTEKLRRFPAVDREWSSAYLRLALTSASSLNDVLTRSRVLANALDSAPEFGDDLNSHPLELVVNFALTRALARALDHAVASDQSNAVAIPFARGLAHALDLDRDRVSPFDLYVVLDRGLARTFESARALDLDLARAFDSARDLGFESALASAFQHALELTRDLAYARSRTLDLSRDLDRGLARAFDRSDDLDLERGTDHARARALVLDRGLDLDLARDLDRSLATDDSADTGDTAVDRELALVFERALVLARALDLDLGRASDLTRVPNLALGLARDLDVERDLDPDFDRVLDLDLDHSLDLAFGIALDLARGFDEQLETSVAAFRSLLVLWTPPDAETKAGEMLGLFDAFLAGIPSEPSANSVKVPESPAARLTQARQLIDAHEQNADGSGVESHRLESFISPAAAILDRAAPFEPSTLACARMGLLAAMALLRKEQREDVAALLEDAWRGLIVLEQRAGGDVSPNEVLLLVRDESTS